jgi:hypothetical protein
MVAADAALANPNHEAEACAPSCFEVERLTRDKM